jgi:hypothetical protein
MRSRLVHSCRTIRSMISRREFLRTGSISVFGLLFGGVFLKLAPKTIAPPRKRSVPTAAQKEEMIRMALSTPEGRLALQAAMMEPLIMSLKYSAPDATPYGPPIPPQQELARCAKATKDRMVRAGVVTEEEGVRQMNRWLESSDADRKITRAASFLARRLGVLAAA